MKAIVSVAPGSPETLRLQDRPDPEPGPGEVRIRVAAASVNFPDLLIIEDKYQYKPERPFSPGAEVAGTVDAVGDGVRDLKPGTRVLAMLGWGGMAEYTIAPAAKVVPIPDAMPFNDAAALVLTYGTSYHALADRAKLGKGETLLVLGAAGGVGLAAVELGVAMGATVLAAASSAEKLAIAKTAGASNGIVYPRNPLDVAAQRTLSAELKALCGAAGPDVIYDPVGGDYSEPALRSIAWQGRYLVVGFPAGIARLPLNLPLLKGCDVVGVFYGAAIDREPETFRQGVEQLFAYYGKGQIRPHIHAVYPLAKAADALIALASRNTAGKVIVAVQD